MKNIRQRLVAFIAGILLGPAIVYGGLETGTYISDLVATNPLSSDLASTADDHIRLLKSTIKTTFPNINGAVTVTDEQLNTVATNVAANPSGSIGLAAVNGSASTYTRSDGMHALSQAIAPTWTDVHIFSNVPSSSIDGSILLADTNNPIFGMRQNNASANNGVWDWTVSGEQLLYRIANDAGAGNATYMTVDRTGTTVDSVAFPTDGAARNIRLGTQVNTANGFIQARTTQTLPALALGNPAAAQSTLTVNNEATSGDNSFIAFYTEAMSGPSLRGTIDYNRAGGQVRYNVTSDIRLKKNFRPAPSARKVIDCILIESYDWIETGNHVDHGLVAQRLEKCAPYAVSKGNVWQVDKSTLIPALIKYLQEQDARIANLERRLH